MNCKPGDMARMVDCYYPESIGLLVEVKGSANHKAWLYGHEFSHLWQCVALTGARSDIGFCMPGNDCVIPDAWLRPIRPDELPEQVSETATAPEKSPVVIE